jgi:hypothetical protein
MGTGTTADSGAMFTTANHQSNRLDTFPVLAINCIDSFSDLDYKDASKRSINWCLIVPASDSQRGHKI